MFAMLVHVHVLHSHSLFLCVCFPRFRMFLLTVQACQENPGWNPNMMFDTCQTHQTPRPNCKSMRPTKKRSAQNRLDPPRQNNLRLREQTLTSLIQRYLRLRQQTLTSFSQRTAARQEEASPNGGNPHPPPKVW